VSLKFNSDIVDMVADTALQQAMLGHYFGRMKMLNEAEVHFQRAIAAGSCGDLLRFE
jgi:hypothetical protein